MNPKLRSVLARVVLIGGVTSVAVILGRDAPHEQTLTVRLGDLQISRVVGVITRAGEDSAVGADPIAGFSRDFSGDSPRFIHHKFSAPNGTYSVVISLRPAAAGAASPIPSETSFERRVSLVGGEVIVSPD